MTRIEILCSFVLQILKTREFLSLQFLPSAFLEDSQVLLIQQLVSAPSLDEALWTPKVLNMKSFLTLLSVLIRSLPLLKLQKKQSRICENNQNIRQLLQLLHTLKDFSSNEVKEATIYSKQLFYPSLKVLCLQDTGRSSSRL